MPTDPTDRWRLQDTGAVPGPAEFMTRVMNPNDPAGSEGRKGVRNSTKERNASAPNHGDLRRCHHSGIAAKMRAPIRRGVKKGPSVTAPTRVGVPGVAVTLLRR